MRERERYGYIYSRQLQKLHGVQSITFATMNPADSSSTNDGKVLHFFLLCALDYYLWTSSNHNFIMPASCKTILITSPSFRGKEPAKTSWMFLQRLNNSGRWGRRHCRPVFWMLWIDWWSWEASFGIRWTTRLAIQIHGRLGACSVCVCWNSTIHFSLIKVLQVHATGGGFLFSKSFASLTPLIVWRSYRFCLRTESFQLLSKLKYGLLALC